MKLKINKHTKVNMVGVYSKQCLCPNWQTMNHTILHTHVNVQN
jgi:hypothetical protein